MSCRSALRQLLRFLASNNDATTVHCFPTIRISPRGFDIILYNPEFDLLLICCLGWTRKALLILWIVEHYHLFPVTQAFLNSEFVFFSSNPLLNHIENRKKCLLLCATNTNIFTLLFKELTAKVSFLPFDVRPRNVKLNLPIIISYGFHSCSSQKCFRKFQKLARNAQTF